MTRPEDPDRGRTGASRRISHAHYTCGGPEGLADVVGNHTRAWQRKTAPYKAQVVHDAAHLLRTASIHDREELMSALADHDGHGRLKQTGSHFRANAPDSPGATSS